MVKYLPGIDDALRALADPTRRAIVERLTLGEASMSELAAPFAISLPAVHRHVEILDRSGLVSCTKRGRVRHCRLEARAFDPLAGWIDERRAEWIGRFDALERQLTEEPQP
ncbi:MAG: metalloregulator ArsR/SmtB family transcription factor [Tepidiformaceae bacterium]